jgi:thiamine pyrophosphate-dependent acetolactate synthase large subunit-like protein
MNLQELASLRENYPTGVGLFLLNNRGYASIGASQARAYGYEFGSSERSGLAFPNWEQLAESFDLPYIRVHTKSELREVLENWNRDARTCLYDLLVPDQEARGPQLVTKVVDGIPITQGLEELTWPEH